MSVVAIGDERVLAGFALAGVPVLARGADVPAGTTLVIATEDAVPSVPPDTLVVVLPR